MPTLKLRAPLAHDLPPLYNLAIDQADKFLDDYESFDLSYAQDVLADPYTLVIDDHGYACGVVWFNNTLDDLHTEMHVLVRPEYWRQVIKQDVLPQAVTKTFAEMCVGKILCKPMHTQKSALRLLRKYKFYEHKPWRKHTRQKGVKVDVILFELRKNYWEKRLNGQRQEQPKQSELSTEVSS